MKNVVDDNIKDYNLLDKINNLEYNSFNNILYSSIHDNDYYFYPFFDNPYNNNNNISS